MKTRTLSMIILCLALLFSGCRADVTPPFTLGEVLQREDFSESYVWQSYVSPEQNVDFQILNNAYRALAWDGGFVWVLNQTIHTDVVIEIETAQFSTFRDNAYGIICRAAPTDNGNGYYFLIGGDGYYTIRRGAADEINALIPWTATSAIHPNQAINRMRAVCIGNYLALYINGEFIAETRDSRYLRGYTGLAAGVVEDGDLEVTFDDLTIWVASIP